MHTKKDASFLITIVLSMLILAYITFVTVYEQILSQNNGFFNVILFGVVLILVFIFITLLARIITVKNNNTEQSPVLRILVFLLIVGIFVLFFISRLKYTSSIYPNDYPVYRAADYISSGNLLEGKDIHNHLISYPADFMYSFLIANIFSITGASADIYVIINISMMIVLAAFLFFTVNILAGKAYAAVAVIICMFMPNHMFLVYTYNSELFVAAVFMISYFLFSVLIYRRFKSNATSIIIALLCGITAGVAISSEPVILLAVLALTVWVIDAKRQTTICALMPFIISIITMLTIAFVKSTLIYASFGEVLIGICMCFVPTIVREQGADAFTVSNFFKSITNRLNSPSKFLNDTFYFLSQSDGKSFSTNQAIWLKLADQLLFIFLLILCVLCVVYILRVLYDKIMPSFTVFVALFIGQLLGGINQVNYIYFISIILVIGCSTIYYMYLNHHPDYALLVTNAEIRKDDEIRCIKEGIVIDDEEADDEEEDNEELTDEYLMRARALVFVGENDILYNQIKDEERTDRINNPIVATRIKTTINDEGEYDSVEEHVEFFDEPDEKIENTSVHEVKAIPASRPVEVVKPVLADDYYEQNSISSFDKEVTTENTPDIPVFNRFDNADVELSTNDANTSNDNPALNSDYAKPEYDNSSNNAVNDNGFVFRKKTTDGSNEQTSFSAAKEKAIKEKASKQKHIKEKSTKEKPTKEKPVKEKQIKGKSLKDVKPGEPLPNPMDTPKPHVNKDMDYDYDVTGNDDYDW